MKRYYLAHIVVVIVCGAMLADSACATDVYFVTEIRNLELTDGQLPENLDARPYNYRFRGRVAAMQPYVSLDGDGEAYVSMYARRGRNSTESNPPRIAVKAPADHDVTGRLFIPKRDATGHVALQFRIPASEGSSGRRKEFLRTKRQHYETVLQRDVPGAAWFRHQSRQAARELGKTTRDTDNNRRGRFFGRTRENDLERTFALVSGGRAVSENLQLDRVLPTSKPGDANVKVDMIPGITVRPIDWSAHVQGVDTQLDALSTLIPADQYALFFPSFEALVTMLDHAKKQGTPLLRAAEPRAEDAGTHQRYQRQLCLPLGALARLFGPQLIASVAVTGGDPYFRTGTDVAVLFQAKNSVALRSAIDGRVALAGADHPRAAAIQGEIFGVKYAGRRSPDREVCCYVATLGECIVVTNSPKQLERLIRVHHGDIPALASLDEYKFFRHRYPLGNDKETGFLIISDDTIRRWCGPRWRIATSRRTRAAAVMSELQAKHLEQLVRGQETGGEVESDFWLPEVDHFTLTARGVYSDTYGSLAFQTPIAEMELEFATAEEKRFYSMWRDGYQRNWSNFFDPIGVSLYVTRDELAADLTVMPLIGNSEYKRLIDISRGAKIGRHDADVHHGALIHWVLAINAESARLKQYAILASAFAPQIKVNPLSWIGNAVSLYADEDSFWEELAKVKSQSLTDRNGFVARNIHRLPVALHVEVQSGLKLAAFLAGMRAFIEQTAPGMTVWETKRYNERPYVKVAPSDEAKSEENQLEKLALYYSASGEALIVTLNEDLLKRALDRQMTRRAAKKEGTEIPVPGHRWIGETMGFQIDRRFVHAFEALYSENYQHMMQARAWGNIPILNEWQHRFPDMDPVQLHEQFWHRRLVCPGGGEYRWNENWQTMESSVYGHPGEPKAGPSLPVELRNVTFGNFGLTFEENGLRARAQLHTGKAKP